MGRSQVLKELEVAAPIEEVFARLTDHEGMARWPGVSRARLVREGSPKNGVGAIRKITAGGLTLEEEVLSFDPPREYTYKIVKGLPVDHLGRVTLSAAGSGRTKVSWHIRMSSRWPLLAQGTGLALKVGLGRALRFVKREAERGT